MKSTDSKLIVKKVDNQNRKCGWWNRERINWWPICSRTSEQICCVTEEACYFRYMATEGTDMKDTRCF
jgi:hypothetical protein